MLNINLFVEQSQIDGLQDADLTCLVAASDKFLRVQRQFWTSLWLGSVRWSPRACIPPEKTVSLLMFKIK